MQNELTYKIGMGGGCHWCTEAIFLSVIGVNKVEQGWIAAAATGSLSEAVVVHFNPAVISVQTLIAIHLHTHSSTSNHAMRHKYRSAIYYFDEVQKWLCLQALIKLQADFANNIITRVLPFYCFEPSAASFRNYYYKNPKRLFCESHINPKLTILLQQFAKYADHIKIPVVIS